MPEKLKPLALKISPETKARLEASIAETARIREAMEKLKELGIDTLAIEEKLNWAEKARDILLKDFA